MIGAAAVRRLELALAGLVATAALLMGCTEFDRSTATEQAPYLKRSGSVFKGERYTRAERDDLAVLHLHVQFRHLSHAQVA